MEVPILDYDNEDTVRDFIEWREGLDFDRSTYDITLDCFGDLKNATVVDFGCGDGAFLTKCIQRGATNCLGLDKSDTMIKKREKDQQSQMQLIVHDCFTELPDNYGQFDFASCLYVANYTADQEEVKILFKNIFRNLKPNGKTVIFVPRLPATVEAQQTLANRGMSMPLRSEMGEEDSFFAYIPVSKLSEDGTRKTLFRFPCHFWPEKKLIKILGDIGFINVMRLHPNWTHYDPLITTQMFAVLEEAPNLILVAEKPA